MAAPYRVVFAPEAATEVTAIAAWWHKNRLAAPRLFQQELKQSLLNIAAFPEIGVRAKMHGDPDVRAIVLRRTGHVVFYDVDHAAAEIQVLRVRHGKRRPLKRREQHGR
ncbi:MAG TPA: type II toxin-antitoxin system RelE/ParE family toxin [Kofleriaceae bacterium]|nr:type II toxin-antitoxin system RelE/ParE family toxin [Kofleriaceae bacterium]